MATTRNTPIEIKHVLSRYAANRVEMRPAPLTYAEPIFVPHKRIEDLPEDYDRYDEWLVGITDTAMWKARENLVRALWALGGLRIKDGSLTVSPFHDAAAEGRNGWLATYIWHETQ